MRLQVAPEDAQGCHIALLIGSDPRRVAATLRRLPGQGVLTVSDVDGFIDDGGMIGIVRSGDRLQFDINQQALQQGSLKASSQLLKLARKLGAKPR